MIPLLLLTLYERIGLGAGVGLLEAGEVVEAGEVDEMGGMERVAPAGRPDPVWSCRAASVWVVACVASADREAATFISNSPLHASQIRLINPEIKVRVSEGSELPIP